MGNKTVLIKHGAHEHRGQIHYHQLQISSVYIVLEKVIQEVKIRIWSDMKTFYHTSATFFPNGG